MKVTVTLSANAGVAIHVQGWRIWVDALHRDRQPGFSAVDVPLQKKMLESSAFSDPDWILFTHCHPDHYSRDLTAAAQRLWENTKIAIPQQCLSDQILVAGEEFLLSDDELTLRFFHLPHEGEQYAGCIHYGILITIAGKRILLPGDCRTAAPELACALGGERVDLALLNFPWLTLKRGQSFIKEYLSSAKLLLYHLPFAPDDQYGYRDGAQRALHQAKDLPALLLCEPLQTVEIEI